MPDGGDLMSFASPAAASAGYWLLLLLLLPILLLLQLLLVLKLTSPSRFHLDKPASGPPMWTNQ